MKIEIKRWDTDEVIHSGEFKSVKACLEDGVQKGISFDNAMLNHAELDGAELNRAKLNYANLNGAELNGAELNRAKLNYANLNGAELNGAKLNYANLNRAKLNGAELNRAELNGAELNYANLNRAKLNGAELNGAELNGAELNGALLPKLSTSIPSGEEYYLFISDQVVQAGCRSYAPDEWRSKTKLEILAMDGDRSLNFYPRLLDLMDFFLDKGERPDWLDNQ